MDLETHNPMGSRERLEVPSWDVEGIGGVTNGEGDVCW